MKKIQVKFWTIPPKIGLTVSRIVLRQPKLAPKKGYFAISIPSKHTVSNQRRYTFKNAAYGSVYVVWLWERGGRGERKRKRERNTNTNGKDTCRLGIEGTPGGTYLVMKIIAKSGSRNRQLFSDDRSWRGGRKRDLEETATNMARYRKSQARQIN